MRGSQGGSAHVLFVRARSRPHTSVGGAWGLRGCTLRLRLVSLVSFVGFFGPHPHTRPTCTAWAPTALGRCQSHASATALQGRMGQGVSSAVRCLGGAALASHLCQRGVQCCTVADLAARQTCGSVVSFAACCSADPLPGSWSGCPVGPPADLLSPPASSQQVCQATGTLARLGLWTPAAAGGGVVPARRQGSCAVFM